MPEVIGFIEEYSRLVGAPVRSETTVTSLSAVDDGYRVLTDQGEWRAPTVVVASGACNLPAVPAPGADLPESIVSVPSLHYRNPDQLPEGGVLVVGASATGLQLADEIHRSGRDVTLAVGEHVRMPRTYRGRDIQWWMDASGLLDERYDEVEDIVRARHVASPQLVGTPERRSMDLNSLTGIGVRLVGRLGAIVDGRAHFAGSLRNVCSLADLKMNRLLNTIDEWATENGLDGEFPEPHRFEGTVVDEVPCLSIDLNGGEIASVVWANRLPTRLFVARHADPGSQGGTYVTMAVSSTHPACTCWG